MGSARMHAITGLYALLDATPRRRHDPAAWAEALIAGGAGAQVVQLRAKGATARRRRALAEQIAPVCQAADVPLVINDDMALALAGLPGVWGLHVGQEDLAELGISPAQLRDRLSTAGLGLGISTHDLGQLEAAAALEPDYLAFGPVFPTRSKADPDPVVGLERLTEAARRAGERPLVAIGGICLETALPCLQAGAAAVAVIGALDGVDLAQVRRRATELRAQIAV